MRYSLELMGKLSFRSELSRVQIGIRINSFEEQQFSGSYDWVVVNRLLLKSAISRTLEYITFS